MKHGHHALHEHCKKQNPSGDFEIDLSTDRQGHALLTVKARDFQQLVQAVLSIADYFRSTQKKPAKKLRLKAGKPERI